MRRRPVTVLAALAALALPLAVGGCAGDDAAAAGPGAAAGGLRVVAAFYPLQFVTERVAGDRAEVVPLTPPGAEPHDLELSARDVAGLADADLVVYEGGFQPAVDEAVSSAAGAPTALDVAPAADLTGADPHFWLDPVRLGAVAGAVADALAELDPDGAQDYAARAAALQEDLTALDQEFTDGLAGCASRTLVTSHEAFGYLAERYDLTQVGISGLSAEDEPDAARLAEVADLVRAQGVTTVYFETLVSPEVAETVAAEAGATTAVLDPLEGLTDDAAGADYLQVQRANLAALRQGQSCP